MRAGGEIIEEGFGHEKLMVVVSAHPVGRRKTVDVRGLVLGAQKEGFFGVLGARFFRWWSVVGSNLFVQLMKPEIKQLN